MSLTYWQHQPTNPPLPQRWIDKLFNKLMARYGSLFVDRFGCLPLEVVKDEWAEVLGNYTGEEISRGLNSSATMKFPPTLPEFVALCRPPVDPYAAYVEAVRGVALRESGKQGEWSNPAIFWAAMEIGPFDLRNVPYQTLKPRWERVLEEQLKDPALRPVPPVAKALPQPDTKPPSPEIRAKIDELVKHMRVGGQRKC